jgi:hypothetical protein
VFFLQAGSTLRRDWKAGWLSKRVGPIHADIRQQGPPARRPFGFPANLLGCVAMGFLFWA